MNTQERNVLLEDLIIKTKVDTETLYGGVALPSLLDRIKALFADIGIMLMVFTATSLVIDAFGDASSFSKGFIFVFMIYLYDPLFTSLAGGTLGHKLMKLKVSRYEEPKRRISLWQAFLRFFMKATLGWISFLTVTGTKHKRGIHDLVSGSIVLFR